MQRIYQILDDALCVESAQSGKVRLLSDDALRLDIVAQRGLSADFASRFEHISTTDRAPAALALSKKARVVVSDVARDVRASLFSSACEAEGFEAMQSTPILGREGRAIGTLSTMFRQHPALSSADGVVLDFCAARLAEAVEAVFRRT
jgi:hypothetical protein